MSIQISVNAAATQAMISGNTRAWIELADCLLLQGVTFLLRTDFPEGPAPYAAFAASLRVTVREAEVGRIRISDQNELEIIGSSDMLIWLSENARGMTEAEDGSHCHVDWISFPEYLEESSSGLVFYKSPESSVE